MTELPELGHLDVPFQLPDDQPLAALIHASEDNFVAAGDRLSAATEQITRMRTLFQKMQAGLGPAAAAEIAGATEAVRDGAERLQSDLTRFVAGTEALDATIRKLSVSVADLDNVVRMISNASVNARILGFALTRSQAQVIYFVENLTAMAADGDEILRAIRAAMSDIRDQMEALKGTVSALGSELKVSFFPMLARLAQSGTALEAGRDDILAVNGTLVDALADISADVGRLIMRLQLGDTVRQRLSAARHAIALGRDDNPAVRSLGLWIGVEQAVAARADAVQAIAESKASLLGIEAASARALGTARSFYIGAAEADRSAGEREMAMHLQRIGALLDDLRGATELLSKRLAYILDQEIVLRSLAQKVRLAGINAILTCARLGSEGRALRELARWLHGLTDEAETIIGVVQTGLQDSRRLILDLTGEGITALSEGTSTVTGRGGSLQSGLHDISGLMAEAARGMDAIRDGLPMHLGRAGVALDQWTDAAGRIDGLLAGCAVLRVCLPQPVLPLTEGSPAALAMAGLRQRYTMQAERDLHDTLLKGDGGACADGDMPPAPVPEPAPDPAPAPAATDDLDDIFF